MKNLILILSFVTASVVQADSYEDKMNRMIDENVFTCSLKSDYAGIELKNFWMDFAPRFVGGTRRAKQQALDCENQIHRLYVDGSPRLFTLLNQIKAIKKPAVYAALFGERTKFSAADVQKIQDLFAAHGLDMNQPLNRLAKTVLTAHRVVTGGTNAEEITLEISRFINREKLSQEAFRRRVEFLPGGSLGAGIIDLELITQGMKTSTGLRVEAQALATLLFRSESANQWASLSYSYRDGARNNSLYNPYAYILFSGRDEILSGSNPQQDGNPALNFAVALMKKDRALLARVKSPDRDNFRATFNADLCQAILGEAVRAQGTDLGKDLMNVFKAKDCRTLNYAANPVRTDVYRNVVFSSALIDLLDVYPRENAELTREVLNFVNARKYQQSVTGDEDQLRASDLEYKARNLIRKCAASSDIGPLAKFNLAFLSAALEANCDKLVQSFSDFAAENEPAQDIYQYLLGLNEAQRKALGNSRLIGILNKLEQRGLEFAPSRIQEVQKAFGSQVTKSIRIARRVHGDPARELVLNASKDDTDEKILLGWRGLKLELNTAKLSDAQLRLIDRIRQAQTEEEVLHALRDATLARQLKERGLRARAKTDFEDLLAKAGAKTLGLSARLDEAKSLLDQTLTQGGRTAAYNGAATSVFDIVLRGRMQCSSGTDFLLLNLSMAGDLVNARQAAVVVQRPQHVLPAVFDFGTRKLGMVESTVDGAGRSEISGEQMPKDTQVVLADDYLLTQALSEALIAPDHVRAALLGRASHVLGLKQGEISPAEGAATQVGDSLNKSIFGFGRADVPTGDVSRAKMEVLPQGVSPEQMVRYSMPRPEAESRLSRFELVKPQENTKGTVFMEERAYKPRFETPEIPAATYDPLAHLITTAQTELIWSNRQRELSENNKVITALPERVRVIFGKLPDDIREEILEQVSQTPRVLADIISRERPDGLVKSHSDSRAQQDSPAVSLRNSYLDAQVRLRDGHDNRNLRCSTADNQLTVCRLPINQISEKSSAQFVAAQSRQDGISSELVFVWVVNNGKSVLTLLLPRDDADGDFVLELRPLVSGSEKEKP